ncbi:hypothetical protein [Nocardia sp. CA-135398]|uniref:hypothetical protein n=1 Tax=Nocardia sp. CA-135398 TaxID=3239977 RepID=UPI003D97B286
MADNGIGFTDHGGLKEFLDKPIAKVLSAFGKLPNGDRHPCDDSIGNIQPSALPAARVTSISVAPSVPFAVAQHGVETFVRSKHPSGSAQREPKSNVPVEV